MRSAVARHLRAAGSAGRRGAATAAGGGVSTGSAFRALRTARAATAVAAADVNAWKPLFARALSIAAARGTAATNTCAARATALPTTAAAASTTIARAGRRSASTDAKASAHSQSHSQSADPEAQSQARDDAREWGVVGRNKGWIGLAAGVAVLYFAWDENMTKFADAYTPAVRWARSARTMIVGDEKPLLPPEMPDPFGARPRTVVLGFEKTLVYSVWDRDEGWKTRKRPGLDDFLRAITEAGYEVVIWSDAQAADHELVLNDLDTESRIPNRLFREHANWSYARGTFKNIERLQRDMKRVIVVDAVPNSSAPENELHVLPWTSDVSDASLKRVGDFLEKIRVYNIVDAREYVKSFNDGNALSKVFEKEDEAAAKAAAQRKTKQPKGEPSAAADKAQSTGGGGGGGGKKGAWFGLF